MTPGQRNYSTYAAYLSANGYISGPWPPWEELGSIQQAGYEAAAVAVGTSQHEHSSSEREKMSTNPAEYATPHGDLYDLMLYQFGPSDVLQHLRLTLLECLWRLQANGQYASDLAQMVSLTTRMTRIREHYPTAGEGMDTEAMAARLRAEGWQVYPPDATLSEETWALIGERAGYMPHIDRMVDDLVAQGYGVVAPPHSPETPAPPTADAKVPTILAQALATWRQKYPEKTLTKGEHVQLEVQLLQACQGAWFNFTIDDLNQRRYADHAAELAQAGLGAWFTIPDPLP